jgi:aspartyl-tRNA(Asn)/glutamyl-tRNA(Gln) amidotransferase subunit A
VVGVKPSFGRVPQWPLGAFASVAVAGPMARSVRDAALMLNALARHDLRDPFCLPAEDRDWRHGIEDGVGGLRIALIRRQGFDAPLDAEGHAALELAARALEAAGAIIEEAEPELPDVRHIFGRVWGVALARLVASVPEEKRELLDAGIAAIAEREARMSAVDFLAAEALRIEAAALPWPASTSASTRADALHADRAFAADQPTLHAHLALWRDWAPLDLRLQPDAAAGDLGARSGSMPEGCRGLCR